MNRHIIIVSGEASGDLYGSLLAKELFDRNIGITISGMGGRRMADAGVEIIADISGTFGLIEVISHITHLRRNYKRIIEEIRARGPVCIVLIDFPDFNLMVAGAAKRLGIKVMYYVSPQVWAWRAGRVKMITQRCDRMAVLLPFEEGIYKDAGLYCRFVGHPAMEEIEGITLNRDRILFELSISGDRPIVAVLPGSRRSEIDRHLGLVTDTVKKLKVLHPEIQYIMPLSTNIDWGAYTNGLDELVKSGVRTVYGRPVETLYVSDLAIVASGTATLQAGLLEKPAVIFYRVSPITYRLSRLISRYRYICLVNILLNKELFPEFLQDIATPVNIAAAFSEIYRDTSRQAAIREDLRRIRAQFEGKRPSVEVAEMIFGLTGL